MRQAKLKHTKDEEKLMKEKQETRIAELKELGTSVKNIRYLWEGTRPYFSYVHVDWKRIILPINRYRCRILGDE